MEDCKDCKWYDGRGICYCLDGCQFKLKEELEEDEEEEA